MSCDGVVVTIPIQNQGGFVALKWEPSHSVTFSGQFVPALPNSVIFVDAEFYSDSGALIKGFTYMSPGDHGNLKWQQTKPDDTPMNEAERHAKCHFAGQHAKWHMQASVLPSK
jgi:hypothetical protein